MKEVIIATKNKGKAREFERMFRALGYDVKTLLDYPSINEIDETGKTFEENAILKAETVARALGKVVIADDSGLMIDALDGAPGIYSARYAGPDKNDEDNIEKVLSELSEVPVEERSARFYCALAVALPNGETETVNGTCEGIILPERRGTNGFGYDPIFFVKNLGRTMAELEPSEKSQISHRAMALKKLEDRLSSILAGENHD